MRARRIFSGFVTLALPALLTGGCSDSTGPSDKDQMLEDIKAATAAFADVNAARAAGYQDTQFCIAATDEGRPASEGDMGVHFVSPALTGLVPPGPGKPKFSGTDGVLDFMRPETLLYEPHGATSLELVGVEYFIDAKAWAAAGNTRPPAFFDVEFDFMEDNPATAADESHGFEGHYELHVWTERENPRGITSVFNPTVTCSHATPDRRLPGSF